MKNKPIRETPRVFKFNPHQPKSIHSQSPPHKKLLKKIENIHKDNQTKNEYSLQEDLVKPDSNEEIQDFRLEIEKRFRKAIANKNYIFPRNGLNPEESSSALLLLSNSELNLSGESLKYVTVYDLSSQNNKYKIASKLKGNNHYHNHSNDQINNNHQKQYSIQKHNHEDDLVDLEFEIRDKSSKTYKKLIGLLEDQFNKSKNPCYIASKQFQNNFEPLKLDNNLNINNNSHHHQQQQQQQQQQHHTSNISNISHIVNLDNDNIQNTDQEDFNNDNNEGYYDDKYAIKLKKEYNKQMKDNSMKMYQQNQYLGKDLSTEKIKLNGENNSFIEKSLIQNSNNAPSNLHSNDHSKLQQDPLIKLYKNNMNLMKCITPKYLASKITISNLKDPIFRTYNPDLNLGHSITNAAANLNNNNNSNSNSNVVSSKAQSNNLYQKTKNEIMNGKTKLVVNRPIKYTQITNFSNANTTTNNNNNNNNNNSSSIIYPNTHIIPKDITPTKDESKKLVLHNFCSPNNNNDPLRQDKSPLSILSNTNKLSKKSSVKALRMISPLKQTQEKDNQGGIRNQYLMIQNHYPTPVISNTNAMASSSNNNTRIMGNGSSQEKYQKKPLFKLDLSKRAPNNRNALTSGRSRNKTTEKFSDIILLDTSSIRIPHENQQQQQHNYSLLNNSMQRNISKKNIFLANSIKKNEFSLVKKF